MKCRHYFVRSQRMGLTLIEVLGGLLLLATLLVAILISHRQQLTQVQRAHQIHDAIDLSQQQLSVWFSGAEELPHQASGFLDDARRYRWRTVVTDTSLRDPHGIDTVRYEVFDASASRSDSRHSLLAVDLFVVNHQWAETHGTEQ